ncbi:hypothetical protein ACI79G_04120 [Geodermatophilus sp. SYSU D00779]
MTYSTPPDGGVPPSPAAALAAYFRQGGQPAPVAAPFRMEPEEHCVAVAPVTVLQLVEGDGTYVHKSGGYLGGGLVGLAALSAARAVGNARRRAKAARRATVGWRPVEHGDMALTNRRIVVQGQEWTDLWHSYLNTAEAGPDWVELQYSGIAPLRIEVPDPAWFLVMLHRMAWNEVIAPPMT